MSYNDSPAFRLFMVMYPGEGIRGVPDFGDSGAYAVMMENAALISALEHFLDETLPLLEGSDINTTIGGLRQRNPELMKSAIEESAIAYFSRPAVATALTGKPSPLFPHPTAMADIDYTLLEPVIARSEENDNE